MELVPANSSSPVPRTSGAAWRRILENDRGLRAGWRLAIFICIFYGFPQLLISTLRRFAPPMPPTPPPQAILPTGQLIAGIVAFLWLLLSTWIMSRIERRPVGSYGLPLVPNAPSRFVSGYVLWGFLPITLVLLVLHAFGAFNFGSLALHGAQIITWGAIWAVVFLSVGLFEEFSFRGYVFQTLADGIGFWPAALILAAGFGAVHMSNPGESRVGIAAAAMFGLFAAATVWRTGNLWLAVGAHAGWDWGQSFVYGVADSGLQVQGHLLNPQIPALAPAWLSGGSVGPEGSVVTLVLWIVMTLVVILFYPRRKPELVVVAMDKDSLPLAR